MRGSCLARLNRAPVYVGHAVAHLDQHRAKTTGPNVAQHTLRLEIQGLLGIEVVLDQDLAEVGSVHGDRILLLCTVLHRHLVLAKRLAAGRLGSGPGPVVSSFGAADVQ